MPEAEDHYEGSLDLALIPGIRLYCLGTNQSREDDTEYQARLTQEREAIDTFLSENALKSQSLLIGGAGDDWVQLILTISGTTGGLITIVSQLSQLRDYARKLRGLWTSLQGSHHQGWRLGKEAALVEACDQLSASIGEKTDIDGKNIVAHELQKPGAAMMTPLPDATFLFLIPERSTETTYYYQADTNFKVSSLGSSPGLVVKTESLTLPNPESPDGK